MGVAAVFSDVRHEDQILRVKSSIAEPAQRWCDLTLGGEIPKSCGALPHPGTKQSSQDMSR